MKYQTRNGCFETNSSASHALVLTVSNSGVYMTREEVRAEFYLDEPWHKKVDGKEVARLRDYGDDNSFGRSPFDVLYTFRDKLNYALAEYCGYNSSISDYIKSINYYEENIEPILLDIIGCDEVDVEMGLEEFYVYSDVGHEYLVEAEEVPYRKRDAGSVVDSGFDCDGRPFIYATFSVPKFGWIDHQSCGLLRRFLKENNLTLRDYLLRKDIVVIIDGDEYNVFSVLKKCGLISDSNIASITERGEL